MTTPLFWKIEKKVGANWRWIASARYQHDAEQLMSRVFINMPRRAVSSNGKITITMPHGPFAPGEFD